MAEIKYNIIQEYSQYSSWFLDIPRNFDRIGSVLYSKRNVIKKVMAPNKEYWVIKRYKKPNLIQRVSYSFFRRSKAARAFLYGRYLRANNINTPKPIGYIEVYNGSLLTDCYFISSYESGINCWFLNDDCSDSNKIHAVANFLVEMHSSGFMHGDTNLSNFICVNCGDALQIMTVDLNRSHIVVNPTREECLDNFMRLTHKPQTMEKIVSAYAKIRGWDTISSLNYVSSLIKKFERREKLKGRTIGKVREYWKRKNKS